jgi:RimJ/RimL family protein N-acetyltransferase
VTDADLPTGELVPDWVPARAPDDETLVGQYCRIERLDPGRHAADLFAANRFDVGGRNWTYLPYGPFADLGGYRQWLDSVAVGTDPRFYAIVDAATSAAVGIASYLRMEQAAGVIEVGHINYSPLLQRHRAGTEAMYLMMRNAFETLGYRRYEWKCNALNAASRRAAHRLGFSYEGTFRQATIVKGRNRDTAWYSVIDGEWPMIRLGFETWLDSSNFDPQGRQRSQLATHLGQEVR